MYTTVDMNKNAYGSKYTWLKTGNNPHAHQQESISKYTVVSLQQLNITQQMNELSDMQ